jgi:hypothetical protein
MAFRLFDLEVVEVLTQFQDLREVEKLEKEKETTC